MAGIDRLHPYLQHALVHDLGWRSLRPVQELTIDAVLDGCNAVVLAPTAGGKTEASIFPLLSRILTEDIGPVAVLYVCPIRALLNNQEERLRSYARMVGLDVFKWHGDVSDSKKQSFRKQPAHILMTTPESLEVMMISAKTDARALFKNLSAIVIDEVHAFAGDDRGAHLASLLERLQQLCGRDIQRIGLSATVGNPAVIGQWLQGSSERPFRLVDPPKGAPQRDLKVEFCADLDHAAIGITALARGKKSLVFVESRAKAEKVALAISGAGVEVFIHHSSVSRADRTLAEEQFARGENTAIVCTSTMELGIDVGDLDQVIQVDAPSSVASFLQRLGRTGRRATTRANCTFFCVSGESLLQTVALLRLAQAGWVESVKPAGHALHVLAHQVMALILQEGGLSRHRIMPWLDQAFPFSNIRDEQAQELIATMVARDILYEADGMLSLGKRGEKLYGRRNFFELYAVFTAPPLMRVMLGKQDIGHIQSMFVQMHNYDDGPLCFRLSGRAWEVGEIDWGKGILHVRAAERGRVPSWLGMPGTLSTKLCQAMMEALLVEQPTDQTWLTRPAQLELASLREGYDGVLAIGTAPIEEQPDGVVWHTFAGGAVNRLLAAGLLHITGKKWIAGNLSLHCKDLNGGAARAAVAELPGLHWETIATGAARGMARGMVSKFQPCLPEAAEDRLLAERLLDLDGVLRFLGVAVISQQPTAAKTTGLRLSVPQDNAGVVGVPVLNRGSNAPAGPTLPLEWINSQAALAHMVELLASQPHIALDVETAPDFGALCLIQIATAQKVYLIDPFVVEDLAPLAAIFGAAAPVKIIHNAKFERKILAGVGLELDGVIDTIELSRQRRGPDVLGGHALDLVCERELGIAIDKSMQTSDWTTRPLSPEQIAYAAMDVEVLLKLHAYFGAAAAADLKRDGQAPN